MHLKCQNWATCSSLWIMPAWMLITKCWKQCWVILPINVRSNATQLPNWPPAKLNDRNPDVMISNVESASPKANTGNRYRFLDKEYGLKK